MDNTTHEIRLKHWANIIEQCQSRPKGQTKKQWLADNEITEKSYYYWLRKIRKQAYEQNNVVTAAAAMPPAAAATRQETPVSFAEIPFHVDNESACTYEKSFEPAAVVKTDTASIAFTNAVSPELLAGIMQEVLHHA